MSTEFRLAWPCPHLVLEEPVKLSADRRTLVTKSPVGGVGAVRVLANNAIYLPREGLRSSAKLVLPTGPYRIQTCGGGYGSDGNSLTVTTQVGAASVALPTGERVSWNDIARVLRVSGVADLVDVGTQVLIEKTDSGPPSFIRVSGSAAAQLRLTVTGARGKDIYPGWDFVAAQDTFPSSSLGRLVPSRYVQFGTPLAGTPMLKVTYTAPPDRCPRCGGTYVENDYRFDPAGSPLLIENEDILQQACLKAILTRKRSNRYHTSYGSEILSRIGTKAVSGTLALIREDVVATLTQVQALQRAQANYQSVSSRERLLSIVSVDVYPSDQDPGLFFIDATVRNASNQPVQITTAFTVPGAVALAGSNGLSLGVR